MYQGKYARTDDKPRKKRVATAAKAEPEKAAVAASAEAVTPAPAAETTQTAKQAPRRRTPEERAAQKRKQGTKVFYTVYFAAIVVFFIAILCVMAPLRDWLVKYEASQPNYKRDQIFQELFADPDWEKIYALAGVQDNAFENSKTYAEYMTALAGDSELTCLETSAGLSGDKKFIVKLKDEKIASFTLTGGAESETDIPAWELGTVEVFFSGAESVIVEKLPGHTVYINGVALDDSYTVRTVSTAAEDYLPEGTHGFRLEQQQVTGLLTVPKVTVQDAAGNEVAVKKNDETGIYTFDIPQATASTEEKELALNATQAYAKYMIGKVKLGEVQKHFSTSSQFYKTISRSEVGWVQSGASYDFTEAVYSNYYRYSDTLFSINIDMTLNQTRFDGSVKEYPLNNTMFFQKGSNGKWLVMEATNVDVQERVEQVRLTFMNGDQVLQSAFIDADTGSVKLPTVTAPEGKVFAGWVTEGRDANGNATLTMVFEASDAAEIYLPDGTKLEPMTLKAHFEEAAKQ